LKKILAIIAALACAPLCAETVSDSVGRRVNINLPVTRIVSLSPAATEMLFAIGAEKTIAAVSAHCDYPEAAKLIEKAGTFEKPDIEKIISLKPGLVISGGGIQKTAIEKLEKAGVPVIVLYPRSLKQIDAQISLLGRLAGSSYRALRAGEKINKRLNAVKAKSAGKSTRVYVEIWNRPPMTAGGTSYINEIISIAGGDNVFSASEQEYPRPSREIIAKLKPQAIFLLYDAGEGYAKRPEFRGTEAVKSGKIFVLKGAELDAVMRPGPRVADAAEIFYKYLYQERDSGE